MPRSNLPRARTAAFALFAVVIFTGTFPREHFELSKEGDRETTSTGTEISLAVLFDIDAWGVVLTPKEGDPVYASAVGGRLYTETTHDEWMVGGQVIRLRPFRHEKTLRVEIFNLPDKPLDTAMAKQRLAELVASKGFELDPKTIWREGNIVYYAGRAGDLWVEASIGLLSHHATLIENKYREDSRYGLTRREPLFARLEIDPESDRPIELQLRSAALRHCARQASSDFLEEGTTRWVKAVVTPRKNKKKPKVAVVAHESFSGGKPCVEPLIADAFSGVKEAGEVTLTYHYEKPLEMPPKKKQSAFPVFLRPGALDVPPSAGETKDPKPPSVKIGTPKIDGSLDAKAVRIVAGEFLVRSQGCYGSALRRNPKLAGKLAFQLTVAPTGEVVSAELASDSLEEKLEECFLRSGWGLEFPASTDGKMTKVTLPIELRL